MSPDVLALIPARGGSKSVPRKNIRPLAGHPLIAYSIAAGLAARGVGRVVVSTDDEEIAAIARACGAEVPFLRPSELAADDTPDLPVVEHALAWLAENEGFRPAVIVQLRPTSPLRPIGLVDQGIDILRAHPDADCVRAVVPSGQNPFKMWRPVEDGRIVPLIEDGLHEAYNMPRQRLPATYWQTGHLDVIRRETVLGQRSLTGRRVYPLMVEAEFAVDIDSPRDFERAEALLARQPSPLVVPPGPPAGSAEPSPSPKERKER
jgi:N-acylneuraminate cytidylyltransferase